MYSEDKPLEYIFVVMEYLPHDLLSLLNSKKLDQVFNEKYIKVLLYNTLCSMHYIHSAGLIHRDLKTDNILVDNTCLTKICDFGIARPCLQK